MIRYDDHILDRNPEVQVSLLKRQKYNF